jgi:hypothetical protein
MSSVIIQTLRPLNNDGTELRHAGRTYHFTRNARGDYVAEVMEQDAAAILSISAGYQVYDHNDAPPLRADEIPPYVEHREPAERATIQPPLARGEHRPLGMKGKGPKQPDA